MSADYLVFSCSLNPASRSRQLATALVAELREREPSVELIDLRDVALPFCDGDAAYGAPQVAELGAKAQAARCVILSVPIYNYDASAAAKNLIELLGSRLEGKVVGFLCAAGGQSSYMSIMSLAASLMLDFRCIILPRFVYATGRAIGAEGIVDPEIQRRVAQLAHEALRVTRALAAAPDVPENPSEN
jgi:NAD(P)H-dependent FMN reductase